MVSETRTAILMNTNSEALATADRFRFQVRHLYALKPQLVELVGHQTEHALASCLGCEAAVAVTLAEPFERVVQVFQDDAFGKFY